MSSRVSTYECRNVVSFAGAALPSCMSCLLYSRRALISGMSMKSSFWRRRRARPVSRRPRKTCLVTDGRKKKTPI